MNKMLPCPCCGRAVVGEWKGREDLGLGWIKGEYEIFCGCGLRMVASANVEAKNLNRVMTMAAQSWNARMIPPKIWQLLRRVGAFLILTVYTDKARILYDQIQAALVKGKRQ